MLDSKYVPLSLENEQKLLLDVVRYLVEICDKEEIQYFLGYGSLLGAVRHHGFIPWDDDIDIVMTRENYDRFNSVMLKYHDERYFFQNYLTDPCFPVPEITRICINSTYKWPEEYVMAPFHTGIYVDIFSLEFCEEKTEDAMKKLKRCAYYHRLMYGKYGKFHLAKNPKKMVDELRGKLTPIQRLQQIMLSTIDSHPGRINRELLCNYGAAFMGGEKLIYNSEWFSESIKLDFCGLPLCCPRAYDKFLRKYYGDDYMTPIKTKAKRHIAYLINE